MKMSDIQVGDIVTFYNNYASKMEVKGRVIVRNPSTEEVLVEGWGFRRAEDILDSDAPKGEKE